MATLDDQQISELRGLAERHIHPRYPARLGQKLGAGASAAVFEVIDTENQYALKVYHPDFFNESNGPAELRR